MAFFSLAAVGLSAERPSVWRLSRWDGAGARLEDYQIEKNQLVQRLPAFHASGGLVSLRVRRLVISAEQKKTLVENLPKDHPEEWQIARDVPAWLLEWTEEGASYFQRVSSHSPPKRLKPLFEQIAALKKEFKKIKPEKEAISDQNTWD